MSPLDSQVRRSLLRVARRAVERAAEKGSFAEEFDIEGADAAPHHPSGVFVTLRRGGNLRGCIGQLEARMSLMAAVAFAATSAALEDPRFERVRTEEVAELTIEISVLTPFEEIAPERVIPGTHGLVVQQGFRRGLLLPQVATEHGLSRERFLEETCIKAGLPRDAWRDSATRIFGFTAEVFSEDDYTENKSGADDRSAPQ